MTAPVTPDPGLESEVRKLPRTDRLLESAARAGLVDRLGRGAVIEGIRAALERHRSAVLAGASCPAYEAIEADILSHLSIGSRGSLRPVVNATGVVIHTNLGRAPLSEEALAAMREASLGYTAIEYDLETGERGDRHGHAEGALRRLTGAEAAVVVNNNAAAVMLALGALLEAAPEQQRGAAHPGAPPGSGSPPAPLPPVAREGRDAGWEVIVSRGQLVEIGGGFRIPDVLRRAGATLVEVGTTNRTYLSDYEAAITGRTRILLTVHRSNFRLAGFVRDTQLEELVELGRRRGLWVVDDLGAGTLLETQPFGLGYEPTVQARVRAGADLVTFSGDKLLGGPQAGILAGRREAIARVKRHPLMRALRVDKVTLAALSATLGHYERGEATSRVPVWRTIAQAPEALRARAEGWLAALGGAARGCEVLASRSAVGGGSLPEVTLPTFVLALPRGDPDAQLARLRRCDPPVVGRIEDDRAVLDARTVMPWEDEALVRGVREVMD
jgi:L-seryl-tRNA(Ser) seleniumtransferase